MYLGKVVEKAPAETLFTKPFHPYTKALLSAIPSPKLKNRKEMIILTGEISSPINPEEKCRFSDRCSFVSDRCINEEPQIIEIEKDHFVSCFLAE